METINRNNCLYAGHVQKTHGIHGELAIQLEPAIAGFLPKQDHFYLEIDGLLVPFFFDEEAIVRSSGSAIVKLENVDVVEKAAGYVGSRVYIDRVKVTGDQADINLLVGFNVEDEKEGVLGTVLYVDDYSGNIVMGINYKGKELLIPLHEEFIVSLSQSERKMVLRCPEGLFDI